MKQSISDQIKKAIFEAVKAVYPDVEIKLEDIALDHPALEEHGDYSTNIALRVKPLQGKGKGESSKEIAEKIMASLSSMRGLNPTNVVGKLWDKIEVAGPGFVNFWLKPEWLVENLGKEEEKNESLAGKKIMVEFAHPNTHKELHIGHMRTLITGEALSRIFEACGAKVFRANYQGDIGPHVAKAMWGIRNINLDEAEKLSLAEKAHLLGKGYIEGNKDYEENKAEIDDLNKKLYQKDPSVMDIYNRTRKWSLDYYDSFYSRFYTRFDKLYFESEMADPGKKIVLENVGKVFEESDGAVIFAGEKYGLHTRVFITKDGNPTYEGKDMALAPVQFADFPFDKCIHVVANEQAGYFQVIIKALELMDQKFVGRQYHLSMGMVQLVGQKISSRTGVLVTVDGLLDDVKDLLKEHTKEKDVLEAATIGAVKYSVLKTAPVLNSTFDLERSVALDGDSGPYLQYTYARAKSVLRKSTGSSEQGIVKDLTSEELAILRYLYRFPEVVEMAAKNYAPNVICTYLFELAKRFNNFYNNVPILSERGESKDLARSEHSAVQNLQNVDQVEDSLPSRSGSPSVPKNKPDPSTGSGLGDPSTGSGLGDPSTTARDFRLALTEAAAQVLKNGLNLLGIEALERM